MAAAMRRSTNVLVGFDMGGTLAVLIRETMRQHTLRIYRTVGMVPKPPVVSGEELMRTIAEVRSVFEGAGEAHRDKPAVWYAINVLVLDRLITNSDHRKFIAVYAKRIHEAFLANEHFQVCAVMLDVVRKLRASGAKVVVTSNSTNQEAEQLLGYLGLLSEFDHVFTSDMLGARKTDPEFWSEAIRRTFPEGAPDDLVAIQVGNSLFSDGFAARHGWDVFIVDRDQRYSPHNENVHLDEQFTPAHRKQTYDDIKRRAIKFVRTPEQLRRLLTEAGYINKKRRRNHAARA